MISSPNRDDLVFPKVTSFSDLLNYLFDICKYTNYQMISNLLGLSLDSRYCCLLMFPVLSGWMGG